MTDLTTTLAGTRAAMNDFISAAERSGSTWTTPRALGKWSPSQVAEHLAIALEQSAKVASGMPSTFPTMPAPMRPLIRMLFFNRVVKNRVFPKSTGPKALAPGSGLPTPVLARVRLDAAVTQFNEACSAFAGSGKRVRSSVFGAISAEDFARFQEVHIRHHCKQLPGAA
jgi:hypothetical protein